MRACWKLPYINPKYFKNRFLKDRVFRIKYKNSVIGSNFINKKVSVYNGKYLHSFDVTSCMVGFKFGEFLRYKTALVHLHVKKEKSKRRKK